MSIFHKATLHVDATPAAVARFITDPARVMAYFPDAIEGGTLVNGEAIWIRASSGTTLIERTTPSDRIDPVSVRVTSTGLKTDRPTRQALADAPLLRFHEDWVIEPNGSGTRITKHWRDIKAFGFMKILPVRWLVRRTANQSAATLEAAWSKA